MSGTLVLQSHRLPLPYEWLQPCLDSVNSWSQQHGYEYRFIDDEFFSLVPPELLEKTIQQKVIATDLARLKWLQHFLRQGYETVVWCDADFLIFSPELFTLPQSSYALGREDWVQENNGKLKLYRKVHNAFLMFRAGNTFLDFYAETAEKLLIENTGSMPPQFIGPKLLTALNNIVLCPVLEHAGMFSPLVLADLLTGEGAALDLFIRQSQAPVYAANLSSSLTEKSEFSEDQMNVLINKLLSQNMLR